MEWQTIQIVGSIVAFVWGVSWFLASKIDSVQKNVMEKLDYHEKHDDQRFEQIGDRLTQTNNNIWELRVTNAIYGLNGNGKKRTTTIRREPAEETSSGE